MRAERLRMVLRGYEAQVNIHIKHRMAAVATVLSIASIGCGSAADQPANPANSTLQQPSISDVPEGNPVQPADPGSTVAPAAPGTDMGG